MKKLTIFLCLLWVTSAWTSFHGIVNNSGSTPADSISIPFYALDSTGNVHATASGDSIFLTVFYPSGAEAFRDSLAYDGAKITTVTYAGYSIYSWKEAVADIDGTPDEGVYSYVLMVIDNTSADLVTPHTGTFQLYATADFDVYLDDIADDSTDISALALEATVQIIDDSVDVWDDDIAEIGAILDSLQRFTKPTTDSLQALLDSIQAQSDDWATITQITDSTWLKALSTGTRNVDTVRSTENVEADSYTPDVNVVSASNGAFGKSDFMAEFYACIEDTLRQLDSLTISLGVGEGYEVNIHTKLGSFLGGAGSDVFTLIDTLRKIAANCTLHVDDLNDLSEEDIFTYEIDAFGDSTNDAGHFLLLAGDSSLWFDVSVDTLPYVGEAVALSNAANEAIADSVKKDSLVYQGAGADYSPSAWDATDTGVVKAIVADTTWSATARALTDEAGFELSAGAYATIQDTMAMSADTYKGTGQDSASTDNIIDLALADYKAATMPSSGAWSSADSIGYQNLRPIPAAKLDSIYLSIGTIDTSSESNIHEKLDLVSGGGGTEAETLIVFNSADSTKIEGARITVRTLDQSTVKIDGMTTDANGLLIAELGDGVGSDSFYVATNANNYTAITDTIIVVSGGGTDSLWMSVFDPGSPSDTGQCRVYVYAGDLMDTLVGAYFRAVPLGRGNWIHSDGRIIIPSEEQVKTNSSGYAYLDIWQTHEVTNQKGDSLYYDFQIYHPNIDKQYYLRKHAVPDSSSYWLRDLK